MQVKMVFIVRKDLNMSHGKMSAQCAHAALNVYKSFRDMLDSLSNSSFEMQEHYSIVDDTYQDDYIRLKNLEKAWEETGETKITLCTSSFEKLKNLHDKSMLLLYTPTEDFFVSNLIVDAGRTELEENTTTCFALFGNSETIDKITKRLQLY